jgi:hypothetical protein
MASDERTTRDMVLLLTAYLSYRALRGRRDTLRLPLRDDERRRLAELERVFGGAAGDGQAAADRPTFMLRLEGRSHVRLPVEFRRDSGDITDGQLGDISASGFFVETAHPGSPGDRVVFKFLDLGAGRAWQFVGEVQSIRAGEGMALQFVGIPLEVRLGHLGLLPHRLPVAA